ncbi:MAG: isoprenyl transferase [Bacteroidia bacterium]|nr:isoprenyl transferase [Bacteroidia bacterium]
MTIKDQIRNKDIPRHIAVIMDGNGRWAKEKGKSRIYGHRSGAAAVRNIVEAAVELELGYLTLYTFSKENWHRSKTEINALMSLLISTINKETKTLMDNQVRLLTIGDINDLAGEVRSKLSDVIRITSGNKGLTLVLAISYGSRWEILNAVKKIGRMIENGSVNSEDITEELFIKSLTTCDIPDPELLIRTSGEFRISNFLLWQIAYSELYFTEKYWPEFGKDDFYQAIIDYQNRERRFGKTSEQLKLSSSK